MKPKSGNVHVTKRNARPPFEVHVGWNEKIKCCIKKKKLAPLRACHDAGRPDFRLVRTSILRELSKIPPTDGNDDVISFRVKSIGRFSHSLRPAGVSRSTGWSAAAGCPFITQPRDKVRVMIDSLLATSGRVQLRNNLTLKMEARY